MSIDKKKIINSVGGEAVAIDKMIEMEKIPGGKGHWNIYIDGLKVLEQDFSPMDFDEAKSLAELLLKIYKRNNPGL